jgi:beta-lactamase regulating signal transducer with metallopeptidase domain
MTVAALPTLVQVVTERLLNTAVEGVVLAGLAWVLLRVAGRQNSGTRFAIWFSALVSIGALPFFSGPVLDASHFQTLPAKLHPGIVLSASLAPYLFALWGGIAALLLLRLGVGLWRVRNLRRNCAEVDVAGLDPATAGIFRKSLSRRGVKLCVSSEVAVPAAVGFFRPAIVFPAWLLPRLSAGEIEVIVLHELAHLRRWDDWTNLAQKIIKAVLFFHPAVWWIESRLTLEREMACDDMVLAQTGSPKAYASSLISFAEKLQNARALALAQALVSRMHQMSLRVAQILDAKRPGRTRLWKPVLGVSAGLLALVFGAAPYAPQFVAFQAPSSRDEIANVAIRSAELQNDAVQKADATSPAAGTEAREPAAIRSVAEPIARQKNLVPQPKAIPAAFNLRTSVVPRELEATSPLKVPVMRARSAQEEFPIAQTIVILRTVRYEGAPVFIAPSFVAPGFVVLDSDVPASRVWTLCIWRIGGQNTTERGMESAIVVGLI